MKKVYAERFAAASYKWIGTRRLVTNMQGWRISSYPGGIGFSFRNYASEKALKVLLKVYREDGSKEHFLIDTYHCGDFGKNIQKWQTHQLPLFPYESCHGRISHITFSYIVHKDGRSIQSQYDYRFATLEDFYRGWTENSDFDDPRLKTINGYTTRELDRKALQDALLRVNSADGELPVRPYFTRGNTWDPEHPVHEIHRQIDRVIELKQADRRRRRTIRLAVYDFDNRHVLEHLIYARQKGVDVECLGDWHSMSSMNCTENIAQMRRADIPVTGVVRNTPCDPSGGIASMHTKIIIFDDETVHCSSYNLHFHLWGGNWEHALFFCSKDIALLYSNIYNAARGGVVRPLDVVPEDRFNLYYSLGRHLIPQRDFFRPQDAIITEINNARDSIVVAMFDIGFLSGISIADQHETDVISALINARDRGVRVRIILNGMTAHIGPPPEPWDLEFRRPLKEPVKRLKDAWIEVVYIYYHESIYSPLHHKFAVFDSHTVMVGSYNWYEASVHSDEVLAVIRDRGLAMRFIDEAERLCRSFRTGVD